MPPPGDEQRRHQTPNPNNPILLSCSVVDSEEVLTEILLRLPVKSLIRFKSVCKRWLSLISSDYFCHQHTLRRPKPQPSLLLQHSGHWSDPDYFYLNPTTNNGKATAPYTLSVDPHEILQACNGLLLLRSFGNYYVYNPTTKKSRQICLANPSKSYYKVALAFDPSKSPYYKVVCIRNSSYQVEVYDSEGHSWRLITSKPFTSPKEIYSSDNDQVEYAHYCDNAILWGNGEDDDIDAYDIAGNEMKTLPFLPNLGMYDSYIQELNGRLYHLKLLKSVEIGILMELWELGGDENSEWLLKCDNFILPCEGDEYGGSKVIRLVGGDGDGDGDGDEAMVVLTYLENGKIRAYDFRNKSFEDLVDFTAPPFDYSDDDDVDSDCGEFYDVKTFHFGEILALV